MNQVGESARRNESDVSNPGMQRTPKVKASRVLQLCLLMVVIVIVSLLPEPDKQVLHSAGRLHFLSHFLVFAAAGYLAALIPNSFVKRLAIVLLISGIGFLIEFTQHKLYPNLIEWPDVLTDLLGVLSGSLAAVLLTHTSSVRSKRNQRHTF